MQFVTIMPFDGFLESILKDKGRYWLVFYFVKINMATSLTPNFILGETNLVHGGLRNKKPGIKKENTKDVHLPVFKQENRYTIDPLLS